MAKYRIVMLRHGESEWNELNLFCGWYNADLSEKGRQEAINAGKAIKAAGIKFDVGHVSALKRTNISLDLILKEIGQTGIPIFKSWRLNERHYGGLTGMEKSETAKKYGESQVQIWRRSFDIPPPPMNLEHKYYKAIIDDPIYNDGPPKDQFPMYESLKLIINRTIPYWCDVILPQLREGKNIIIVAHGSSLRSIVKHIDSISDEDITKLNLPTGIPFIYEFDENLKPIVSMKFLSDDETVKKAMEEVANQGKIK